jgi:hypothetical protein
MMPLDGADSKPARVAIPQRVVVASIHKVDPSRWREMSKSADFNWHVYLIQEGDSGAVKIGISRNAFWRRTELQGGNPRRIELRAVYESLSRPHTALVEKAVLREFASHRLVGEWMCATWMDVASYIDREFVNGPN